jgi:hypothetical protein
MNPSIFKLKKLIFTLVVILILAGVGGYYYFQYQKTQKLLKDPTQVTLAETKALVDKVGELIELPSEEPRVATVSDKTKLIGQSFFAKAENGDKVLIYTLNKKAILYRPSTNKIIEVSSVNIQTDIAPQASPSGVKVTPSVSPAVNISPTLTPTSTVTPTP